MTLAAVIDPINETRSDHVVSIEGPILRLSLHDLVADSEGQA